MNDKDNLSIPYSLSSIRVRLTTTPTPEPDTINDTEGPDTIKTRGLSSPSTDNTSEPETIQVRLTTTSRDDADTPEPRTRKRKKRKTEGLIPITEAHWSMILKLYLRTYRGPNAEADLRHQLKNYQVLRKSGKVANDRFVRYLARGFIDCHLKKGGWVTGCNASTIHLRDGKREWGVSRFDNYIFVRDENAVGEPQQRKSILRLLAEEALHAEERK